MSAPAVPLRMTGHLTPEFHGSRTRFDDNLVDNDVIRVEA
jgi:hypothetical protein